MSQDAQPLTVAEVRERFTESPSDHFVPFDPPGTNEREVDWLYPDGGFELALLHRIVAEGFAANAFVHYAKNIGRVPTSATFECVAPEIDTIELQPTGSMKVFVDDVDAVTYTTVDGTTRIEAAPGHHAVRVEVTTEEGTPAALGVPRTTELRWVSGRKPVNVRPGGSSPPHLLDEPIHVGPLLRGTNGFFDAGRPVLGRPVVKSVGVPLITSGESPEEAHAVTSETRHEVVQRDDGYWTTHHRLGFRYLRIEGTDVEEVHVEANMRALPPGGAFVCSDVELNNIWTTATYTLEVCMQGIVLDGIKRDRMPWLGDQAANTLTNAFAIGDAQIIRDGLAALGRPTGGYVNGIADYSLWWLINRSFFSWYFGDSELDDADHVAAFILDLDTYATPSGIFRPAAHGDDFIGAGGGPVFIDWGVTFDASRDLTALQMLWYWALMSAADVLSSQDHATAVLCADRAAQIRSMLWNQAWDHGAGAWREYLDGGSPHSAYPNFLAVLAGLHEGPVPIGVQSAIREGHTGTPFMTGFALRAQAAAGDAANAVQRMRALWSPMLTIGHGTFWEEFDSPDVSPFEMYGRPFGKSLCHAWASAPAALLPEILLGIRPLEHGWKRFAVQPALGELEWATAIVPTPYGEIFVSAGTDGTIVNVPRGAAYVHPDGHTSHGPVEIHLEATSTPVQSSTGSRT